MLGNRNSPPRHFTYYRQHKADIRPSAGVVIAEHFSTSPSLNFEPLFLVSQPRQDFRACPVASIRRVSFRVTSHFLSSYHCLLDCIGGLRLCELLMYALSEHEMVR